MSLNNSRTYGHFLKKIHEAEAYDEPADAPNASIRQEDWAAKDRLSYISNMAEEIMLFLEDGEQLEKSQLDIIQNLYDSLEQLKRQIEGREEIRSQEQQDEMDAINNPNL